MNKQYICHIIEYYSAIEKSEKTPARDGFSWLNLENIRAEERL